MFHIVLRLTIDCFDKLSLDVLTIVLIDKPVTYWEKILFEVSPASESVMHGQAQGKSV